MSLAPLAYLLYQRVMRHDPTDPNWSGRDRFILSNGHSSLTSTASCTCPATALSSKTSSAAHLGLADARTPRARSHAGVEITTGPLGQGVGNGRRHGDGRPARTRPVRPDAAPGESPFDHHI